MEEKYILCVGLCCVDIVNLVKQYPKEDSDRRDVDHRWSVGGNATNSCTVLTALGARAEFMGTLAESTELPFIKQSFEENNIKYDQTVYHKGCKTPLSIVIVNLENGSRTILHGKGNPPKPELTYEDMKNIDLSLYHWIHFEGRPNSEAVKKMLKDIDDYNRGRSKDDRITTSVELEATRQGIETLLDSADVVFIGKEYAMNIAGLKNKDQVLDTYMSRCRKGARLICAWGEEGAVAQSEAEPRTHSPIFPPPKVIDTLGAGDTFNAATILSLSKGNTLKDAISFGCQVAGAKCGMQGFKELKEHFHTF